MKLKALKLACNCGTIESNLSESQRCAECRAKIARWRRLDLIATGTAPKECSRELPVAPARGQVVPFRESIVVPSGDEDFELVDAPYRAGCPGRARDIFDVMTAQATRRKGATAPFTALQVGTARDYRDLNERIAGAGVKCSKTFDDHVGGQGGGEFMDAFIRDKQRLSAFEAAIGEGVAMETRRRRAAHVKGVVIGDVQLRAIERKIITTQRLVDMVCIEEKPLGAVLKLHGWCSGGKNIITLRAALCAALSRMQGI
ncbi:hypothetical protein [Thalassobius sp. I31.1]|uniref:hypothetical protein n=1 Tax=Thalassobius sp. I31.1 TaxID=2109912 RepID=UPI000D1A6A42|nr:hypothetical protein [Thalassobius sp. I31.1]